MFQRWDSGFVTAAAANCLMLTVIQWSPGNVPVAGGPTYVEILADTELETSLEQ